MSEHPSAGTLLIATPRILDPNFCQTVVLLCEHDENGSFGLVVNRPLPLGLNELLERADIATLEQDPAFDDVRVFFGGPVETGRIMALRYTLDDEGEEGDYRVTDGIFLVRDIESTLIGIREGALPGHQYRIAVGYAGWGEGQLSSELERDDWVVQACHPRLIFATRPDTMWSEAMRRQGHPDIEPGSPPLPSMN